MSVYHADAPGQPNGRFGHRDDWEFCTLCPWWSIPGRCWGDTPVCATESYEQAGYCLCRTDKAQERNA